jgi:hypothetical protein
MIPRCGYPGCRVRADLWIEWGLDQHVPSRQQLRTGVRYNQPQFSRCLTHGGRETCLQVRNAGERRRPAL